MECARNVWAKLTRQLAGDGEFESPPVCLLVTVVQHSGDLGGGDPESTLQWCVENGFELIEWNPGEKKKGLCTRDGRSSLLEENETSGSARLAEALEAHVWPDMLMKSGGKAPPKEPLHEVTLSDKVSTQKMLPEDDVLLAEGLEGEKDNGNDTFEGLFAKFADMKGNHPQHALSWMT